MTDAEMTNEALDLAERCLEERDKWRAIATGALEAGKEWKKRALAAEAKVIDVSVDWTQAVMDLDKIRKELVECERQRKNIKEDFDSFAKKLMNTANESYAKEARIQELEDLLLRVEGGIVKESGAAAERREAYEAKYSVKLLS